MSKISLKNLKSLLIKRNNRILIFIQENFFKFFILQSLKYRFIQGYICLFQLKPLLFQVSEIHIYQEIQTLVYLSLLN